MTTTYLRRWAMWGIPICCTVLAVAVWQQVSGEQPSDEDQAYPPQMEAWYGGLKPDQRDGLDTWYQWTAGNERMFRHLAAYTEGRADFLKMGMVPRARRFTDLGAINNPDCVARTEPDEYGLLLDDCVDPNEVGIMGLRKFPNPKFEPAKWGAVLRYQGYLTDADLEPPYLIGASCGICHVAFNPIRPPADPAEPEWENLLPAFGNQYIKESALFSSGADAADDRFALQVLLSQPAGTSDTSRMATDHIDNPSVINSIQGLAHRPVHREQMPAPARPRQTGESPSLATIGADNEGHKPVPHVLKDGADSIGLAGASLRVYVNLGMCSDSWLSHHELIRGRTPQQPFDIEAARRNCYDWRATERRLGNVEAFLKTQGRLRLQDAPDGRRYLSSDPEQVLRGATVFAGECARCHSSKVPPGVEDKHTESAKPAWVVFVTRDVEAYLEDNFLSDDQAYPVASSDERFSIGTNAARTMGTNATEGQIYAQFSSRSYKARPAVGTVNGLFNPFTKTRDLRFDIPAGGRGYYRTPSLLSVWATAPFLHNNSLGRYTHQPSVDGRLEAFADAMEKLLWPAKRDNERSIKVTDRNTTLELGPGLSLRIPKGTPIKLVANIHLPTLLAQAQSSPDLLAKIKEAPPEQVAALALKFNQVPDFVEDRGHTFGTALPDGDKRALIEFLKTF